MNEVADLLETPSTHGRGVNGADLVTTLGERVEWLVERYRATRCAVDELGAALVERDRRIVELDAKLAGFERLRRDLTARIDALLAELDRLAQAGDERAA